MKATQYAKVVFVAIVAALPPSRVDAATKYWKNSVVSGNWDAGSNWSNVAPSGIDNGGVPALNDQVNISPTDGAAHTVTYNVTAPTLSGLVVDLTGPPGPARTTFNMPANNLVLSGNLYVGLNGRATFDQNGGNVSTNLFLDIGRFGMADGIYNLHGGSLTAFEEYVGDEGIGYLIQDGGSNSITGTAGLTLGWANTGNGTYAISGGTLAVTNGLVVGRSGRGMLDISNGALVTSASGILGSIGGANSEGIVTVGGANSQWTISGSLDVGGSGKGTLTIQNQGTVHVGNAFTINGTSTVNLNGGTLRLSAIAAGALNRLNFNSGTVQLAGGHTFGSDAVISQLLGPSKTIPAGKGLTIEGSGVVGAIVNDDLIVRGGTLNSLKDLAIGFNGNGTLTIDQGGKVVAPNSIIGNQVGPGNSLGKVFVDGAGSYWQNSADLTLGSGPAAAGELYISNGALVRVNNALILSANDLVQLDGGTLRFSAVTGPERIRFNSGTIELPGNHTIGADSTIQTLFGAAPVIPDGKGLTVVDTATFITTLTLDGGTLTVGRIVSGQNLRLRRGTLNITNDTPTIGPGGSLGATLDVADDLTVQSASGFTNQGLVTGGGQIGGRFRNEAAGELRAEPGRSLLIAGQSDYNAGQIKLFGGQLEFTSDLSNFAGGRISGNGTLIARGGLINAGVMNFSGTANIVGDVINFASGKIISAGGGPTTFFDDVTNNGEIRTSTNSFTVFFGNVSGSGSFTGTGTVNFEGDLNPGNSPAAVNFGGDVAFGPDAALQVEIGGTALGTQFDQLLVAGALDLGGTLDVSLINGFTPSAGQAFNILDWGSLAGTFSSISLPSLAGLAWDTSQLYTTGVLSVAAAGIPGDYNRNGTVDAADYIVWRKGLGSTYTQNDYDTWRAHFGQTTGTGSAAEHIANAAAPEPSTILLLIVAVMAVLPKRRGAVGNAHHVSRHVALVPFVAVAAAAAEHGRLHCSTKAFRQAAD